MQVGIPIRTGKCEVRPVNYMGDTMMSIFIMNTFLLTPGGSHLKAHINNS